MQVVDRKSWGSSKMKNSSQNGTSWAFEFGDGLQSCPIVVEDLEYPGHMLIEVFAIILITKFTQLHYLDTNFFSLISQPFFLPHADALQWTWTFLGDCPGDSKFGVHHLEGYNPLPFKQCLGSVYHRGNHIQMGY